MAGGAAKYRHLSRSSSHRQALLRNLVTSLFKHESITTTWAKAKEAQRLAEKLITLGKKNTEASRKRALSTFYVCSPCPKKANGDRDLKWDRIHLAQTETETNPVHISARTDR
jgi:ribosomal protein L17